MKMEASDKTILDVLPVGTRVCDKNHPKLVGTIRKLEFHESGKISPIPYNITWDNHGLALELRGIFSIYGGPEDVIAIY